MYVFLFITLNISCHSLRACRAFAENQLITLWEFPCMLFVAFPLLCLIFFLWIQFFLVWLLCLSVFLLGFVLYGTVCDSSTWVAISFPKLGKFSTKICCNSLSDPFSSSCSSGTPIIQTMLWLMLSQKSLWWSISFFFLYSAPQQLFPPFCVPPHLSVLLPLKTWSKGKDIYIQALPTPLSFLHDNETLWLLWLSFSMYQIHTVSLTNQNLLIGVI